MTPTTMALIMIAVIIVFILTKKAPMQFVLMIVPIVCALFLGVGLTDLSTMIVDSMHSTMKSCGYMLCFALMYFTMLQETGMFETLVNKFMKLTKGKLNIYLVMAMTTFIAFIGMMTATVVTGYLIVFPIMIPLYEKLKFDKKAAMIITQTALGAMCFLPWGIGISMSAVFAGVDTMVLAKEVVPISLCFLPVIVLQWMYFARRHKKQGGLMSVDLSDDLVKSELAMTTEAEVKEYTRPRLFAINLIIFIVAISALAILSVPAYLVFIIATLLTTLINYPAQKDYQVLWGKAGKTYFNTLIMLLGISVFVGVFKGTGMVEGIAELLATIFPQSLARYMHLILLAICVIVIRFIPYQLYNSLYPVLISIGSKFGLTAPQIIAPYVNNIALATGSSPLTATTHVGIGILELNTDEYCNLAVKVQTVTNILIILIAVVTGAMH